MDTLIYTPANWLDSFDWRVVFPVARPVEIDIGCGKGAFLLWAAGKHPQTNFLGVERLLVRLRKVDRKALRQGLTNLRLVRIEASYLVAKLVPDASVSAYHIYFPDPWPKRRHHRRRLFTRQFVVDLHRTLVAGGGEVRLATDHGEYFEQARSLLRDSGGFDEAEPAALPEEGRTDFEREFLAHRAPIFRGRYVRRN